jgi:hypothetical protein
MHLFLFPMFPDYTKQRAARNDQENAARFFTKGNSNCFSLLLLKKTYLSISVSADKAKLASGLIAMGGLAL